MIGSLPWCETQSRFKAICRPWWTCSRILWIRRNLCLRHRSSWSSFTPTNARGRPNFWFFVWTTHERCSHLCRYRTLWRVPSFQGCSSLIWLSPDSSRQSLHRKFPTLMVFQVAEAMPWLSFRSALTPSSEVPAEIAWTEHWRSRYLCWSLGMKRSNHTNPWESWSPFSGELPPPSLWSFPWRQSNYCWRFQHWLQGIYWADSTPVAPWRADSHTANSTISWNQNTYFSSYSEPISPHWPLNYPHNLIT